MRDQIRIGSRALWVALLANLYLVGCQTSDDRALVIFDVTVGTDVPDFKTLSFTSADAPTVPPRDLDGPTHRQPFRLGYYVPSPRGTVTVMGRAVLADGCVVGEGMATASGVEPKKQVSGGSLIVSRLDTPRCPGADGGRDADGAVDLAADALASDGRASDALASDGRAPDSRASDGLALDALTSDAPGSADSNDAPRSIDGPIDTPTDSGAEVVPPACVESTIRCADTTSRERCTGGQWIKEACTYACVGADCGGSCVPKSLRCNPTLANQPQTCGDDGAWHDTGTPCAAFCTTGVCTPACQAGQTTCNGNTLQSCSAAGAWIDTMPCAFVCDITLGTTRGRCSGVCKPADRQCSAAGLPQLCDATGAWRDQPACGGATPTCSAGACVCASPRKACGGVCTDVATDKNNCVACGVACLDPPANGAGICQGAAGCGVQCTANHLKCGNLCCDSPPVNAVATCSGGTQCGVQCSATYHACLGSTSPCYSDSDVAHCGTGCLDCRQANANQACGALSATQCANTCLYSTLSCPGTATKPTCGSWDFESLTNEGWSLRSFFAPDLSGGIFGVSASRAFSGIRSLSIGHNDPSSLSIAGGGFSTALVDLCPSLATLNLSQNTFSVNVYIDPTTAGGSLNLAFNGEMQIFLHNGVDHTADIINSQSLNPVDGTQNLPARTWTRLTAGLGTAPISAIEIEFRTFNDPWVGTVYFDDIRIE